MQMQNNQLGKHNFGSSRLGTAKASGRTSS